MKANQDYGIALHILAYLAYNDDEYVTSNRLASSIDTNAVVVRRMLSVLSKAGFVETKRGHFGSKLKVNPNEITFYDVYNLFSGELVVGPKHDPNVECEVGVIINKAVKNELKRSSQLFEEELKRFTIGDIHKEIIEERERGK